MNNSKVENNIESLNIVINAQRKAFMNKEAPSLTERQSDLNKLRNALITHRREIEDAVVVDFGHRSRHETAIIEITGVTEGIKYLQKNLRHFMRPNKRHVALHMRFGNARVEYQPLGVVGIMSPWNYPINLSLMPLVTAIAAGNRVMLKPSEFTPATNQVLESLLGSIFSKDQVAVINGDATVGAAFSALPFDHLVFTGSTAVGSMVMKAASANLVPVTLELGGKSPVIVAKGSPLQLVTSRIVFGKLLSAGQTCIAPDYALVHESEIDDFIKAYTIAAKTAYPKGMLGEDYTSIINSHHYERLLGLITDARNKGAEIVEIGNKIDDKNARPHTLPPIIIRGVTDDMRIAQEEIFGPILPIVSYSEIVEAIKYVNERPRPLALYYFGNDDKNRREVLSRTTSGNVTINGTFAHIAQDDLPFGGVGASGIGKYHGIEGFRTLSHAKGIFEQGRFNGMDLLRPPFGRVTNLLLKLFLR